MIIIIIFDPKTRKDLRRAWFHSTFICPLYSVTIRAMSSQEKKILFFIKNPADNLKSVETFLNKRNFIVHIEADIKVALGKILELQPHFVFIAWDHTNKKVITL